MRHVSGHPAYRVGRTLLIGVAAATLATPIASGQVDDVLRELNSDPQTVAGTADSKSYKILFDAYLELSPPPRPIGPGFNLTTIYPGMSDWASVSGWAESNPGMAEAILACKDKRMIGLPYGTDAVDANYVQAGLVAEIAAGGSLRHSRFPYLAAVDTIAAYAVAETYRLIESGQVDEGLDLSIAQLMVLRQFCDRGFLAEKINHIQLLIDALSVLRDMMFAHMEQIEPEKFKNIALWQVPSLSPDRNHLFMPEGDRVVSKALIDNAFDHRTGRADPQKFAETFAGIQSRDEPLTRFGAARRWKMIASVHDSLEASQQRLELVYDDWWRRWRVQAWDGILDIKTQFDRTNPVRYAAVIYSTENIERVFGLRNQLVAGVDGTALSAGLCAYKRTLGNYPDDLEKIYGVFAHKRTDADPFDRAYGVFQYRRVGSRTAVDTRIGRVWVDAGTGLLYSLGQDQENGRASDHSDDGAAGDIVLWPPMRTLERQANLLN